MFLSRLELSSLSAILGVLIASGLVGGLGMFLYQKAVSWRLRRFVRKNCAGCMTPDTDALVMHAHPISAANRDDVSGATWGDFGTRRRRTAEVQSAAISADCDAQAAAIRIAARQKEKDQGKDNQ